MPYQFQLARPADDPALRQILQRNPVPGQMALTYEREPDYFRGCSVMGHTCQTLIARHQPSGQAVGLATRSVRQLFVNGAPQDVGYIGQLRVDSAHRGRWLLPQGFRLFHELHQDRATRGYLTTIIDGNREAEALLVTKARRHYPAYRPLTRLYTLALILRQARPPRPTAGVELRNGAAVDLPQLIAFLRQTGARRQFFPALNEADFHSPATRDFRLEDFLIACQGGQIVGALGLWDQSAYKQTVVQAYSPGLARLKPLYNLAARLLRAQPLTRLGQPIRFAYAAFACVQNDDPAVFQALLAAVCHRAASRGFAFLMLGLCAGDPLLPLARRRLHIPYTSTLYTVCWAEDESWRQALDARPPHVEISSL